MGNFGDMIDLFDLVGVCELGVNLLIGFVFFIYLVGGDIELIE